MYTVSAPRRRALLSLIHIFDGAAEVQHRVQHGQRFVFGHVDLIQHTKAAALGAAVYLSLIHISNAAFGIYLTVFVLYFFVCWPISLLASYLEKKWK